MHPIPTQRPQNHYTKANLEVEARLTHSPVQAGHRMQHANIENPPRIRKADALATRIPIIPVDRILALAIHPRLKSLDKTIRQRRTVGNLVERLHT